jgi:hypothetical protein
VFAGFIGYTASLDGMDDNVFNSAHSQGKGGDFQALFSGVIDVKYPRNSEKE